MKCDIWIALSDIFEVICTCELVVELLTALGEGRLLMRGLSSPSSYCDGNSLWRGVFALPHNVWFLLLQLPSIFLKRESGQLRGGVGQVSSILLPFRLKWGRAKVPCASDKLNRADSCTEVSSPSAAFFPSATDCLLVDLNLWALKAAVPRLHYNLL